MLFASGGARLSDAPGIALKVGAVLALVTSWSTFQTLVFDMAARAPVEIAGIVAAPMQEDSHSLAADPVGGLQIAYDQLTSSAVAFGKIAGPTAKAYTSPEASAAEALSTASGVLFMTTAGVIAAATLSIGVLTAIGPVFIVLFLIPATRGLFTGWVRALTAAALTLLVGWLVITLLLSVLEPWLIALADELHAGVLKTQTAVSAAALVFVFGVGQIALLAGACVMAFGFRLRPRSGTSQQIPAGATARGEPTAPAQEVASRAQRLAFDLQRDQAIERARPAQLAAAVGPSGARTTTSADHPARLGDNYRRPAAAPRRLRVRA
jgi:type IV secretion system protein VirB6